MADRRWAEQTAETASQTTATRALSKRDSPIALVHRVRKMKHFQVIDTEMESLGHYGAVTTAAWSVASGFFGTMFAMAWECYMSWPLAHEKKDLLVIAFPGLAVVCLTAILVAIISGRKRRGLIKEIESQHHEVTI